MLRKFVWTRVSKATVMCSAQSIELTRTQPSAVSKGACLTCFGKMYSMKPSAGMVVAGPTFKYRSTISSMLGGVICTVAVEMALALTEATGRTMVSLFVS